MDPVPTKIFTSSFLSEKLGKRLKALSLFMMPALVFVLLLIIPILGSDSTRMPGGSRRHLLVMHLLLILIFYVHNYLFKHRRSRYGMWRYICGVFACFFVFVGVRYILLQIEPPVLFYSWSKTGVHEPVRPPVFFSFIPFFIVTAVGFAYSSYLENIKLERINKEKENLYLKTELDFLTSQLSPHFMFNVLNTLVGMARKKSDELEVSLINLSGLIRYVLGTANSREINLSAEIEYLQGYIALQMLRFGDDLKLDFKVRGELTAFSIHPMLLIPLVENAFKHGIGIDIQQQIITIIIEVDHETRTFEMSVANFFSEQAKDSIKESGIGLPNLSRRLQLLYPDDHEFNVNSQGNTFLAKLRLRL
jgi:two-component system LytT family sensor kinase